jgi:hypothetical protein
VTVSMRVESRKMMIKSGIIPPRLGKFVLSPGEMGSIVTAWEEWVGGCKVKREGVVGVG